MSTAVNDFLDGLAKTLEGEADTKVTKAMRLWIKCDNNYKMLVLHLTGFDRRMLVCPCAAKHLRDHFDTMDLMDDLDSCIEEMEDEIRSYPTTTAK
jgi:hypothetical protein